MLCTAGCTTRVHWECTVIFIVHYLFIVGGTQSNFGRNRTGTRRRSGVRPDHRRILARLRPKSNAISFATHPAVAAGFQPDWGRNPTAIWPQRQDASRPKSHQNPAAIWPKSMPGRIAAEFLSDHDQIVVGIRSNPGRNWRRDCGHNSGGFGPQSDWNP